ncbi:hypothetical protein Rmf_05420 [Roseomonas fluvialis]|uniref:Uncharacterized protein n=1 Tax=Roseomonas fluvialis TaxID=1750527 RepID=A0ABN6NXM0_9PROT|nr:hypothetical protein Rmf_05420 [Roseomonas fluvialis]
MPQHGGAKHQAEMLRVGRGEADVAAPRGEQGMGRILGHAAAHAGGQAFAAFGGKGGKQPRQVAEMRCRGGMRDTRAACRSAQAQRVRPGFAQDLGDGIEKGATQRAVVMAAGGLAGDRHGRTLRRGAKLDNGQTCRN